MKDDTRAPSRAGRPKRLEATLAQGRWLRHMDSDNVVLPVLPANGKLYLAGRSRPRPLVECAWSPETLLSNDEGTSDTPASWLPRWFLTFTQLPIIITYRLSNDAHRWVPCTLVAESCVLMSIGRRGEYGLWSLEDGSDELPVYEGACTGSYRTEAAAAEAAGHTLSRHVITTRRPDRRWAYVDGAHARPGGVQRINDVRGTGRTSDVLIHADRRVTCCARSLKVPNPLLNFKMLSAAEVLTSYGDRFWAAAPPVANGECHTTTTTTVSTMHGNHRAVEKLTGLNVS